MFIEFKSKYLVYFCDGIGSVFDSQVLELIKSINQKKVFKKVFLFLGLQNDFKIQEIQKKEIPEEIRIIFFKSYPNYFFLNFIQRRSIRIAINSIGIDFGEIIFHTRGELLAWHLCKIVGSKYCKNIIPDVRGVSIEEVEEYFDINIVKKKLKVFNYNNAFKGLDYFNTISVVSRSLKEYIINNYQIELKKIFIIPCLSGNHFRFNLSLRDKIRGELNLHSNDFLIAFSSGGIANWQNNDVLEMLADKGLKVLNLSKKEILHKNVINKFVSYSEMPLYLNAADAAIIWRDKSIVNKVASPVKFSEYICCGLPVIANYSVDMITDYITKNDCGLLLDNFDDIEMSILNPLMQKDRKKISESGILNFGIDIITNKYLKTYLSIDSI